MGDAVSFNIDHLEEMWDDVERFQRELGLDPESIPESDRRGVESDMLLGLHEEAAALQRRIGHYKRHILASAAEAARRPGMPPTAEQQNIAVHIADVMRYAIIIAQLHGISQNTFVWAWRNKGHELRARAEAERLELVEHTKVFCVDMDDVICDLSSWPKEYEDYNGTGNAKKTKLVELYKDEFHSSGRFRDLPIIPGARDALATIQAAGYKVVIITARPSWQYKRIYADTLYWLKENDVPHDLLLFNKDKAEAIHKRLHPAWPVAFVEDHPRNAIAIASLGIQVYLYNQPHNAAVADSDNLRRVNDWHDILVLLGLAPNSLAESAQ